MSVRSPTNNEELIRHMINYSKEGPLAQMFIMDAITKQAEKVASATPEELNAAFEGCSYMSAEAWQRVAKEIKAAMDKFYNR